MPPARLTQSSVIGTASGALAQLGLPENVLKQQEANIAAGYAVTYVLGYILTLLFVPFVAPKLMRVEPEGGGGEARGGAVRRRPRQRPKISPIANSRHAPIASRPPRAAPSRTSRTRSAAAPSSSESSATAPMSSRSLDTVLEAGDDIVIAGRTAAIVAAKPVIGNEIDADEILRAIPGNVVDVLVDSRKLHGRPSRRSPTASATMRAASSCAR